MLAEAHPPSSPGRRTTLHHRDRSNNSQNHPRAGHASAAPRSIPDDEYPLGGGSEKPPATLVAATALTTFILVDRSALTTAANETVAKTTAELHTNADSRQRGKVTGPDGR